MPATALPCAGCHGRDGQGRPEGGVRPSDITWFNLSREYGGVSAQGRRFRAYDEDWFLRAVSEGIDSSGNKLDSSMPRYNISRRDARDLIAYLKVIQDEYDPGVSDETIVVGTLQPDAGIEAALAEAMLEVMRARFAEVNRQGGIYGKRLQLAVSTYSDRDTFIAEANRMIDDEGIFALVNVFSSTADETLSRLAEAGEMPSIAPYTEFPGAVDDGLRQTFYLYGGLLAQVEALARHAAGAEGPAFVLYRRDGGFGAIAEVAKGYLEENGYGEVELVEYVARPVQALSGLIDPERRSTVLFLGPAAELAVLANAAADGAQAPRLLLPGYFVSSEIVKLPDAYAGGLEMSYTIAPIAGESGGIARFREFVQRNAIGTDRLAARQYAFGATELLLEGIKRAGKRVTRKKLLDEMEQFYVFDAGLSRPLTFGSQQRVGMRGAHIVRYDSQKRRLVATDLWVRLD